jgi:hypothetical protein
MIRDLVINKLTDPGFLARVGRGSHGHGMDSKREKAWCEYGYRQELTFDDYYGFWSRTGVGFGAVKVLVDKCWETNPATKDQRFSSVAKESGLWNALRMADTFRLAGAGWSALLLTITGDAKMSEPAQRGGATKGLTKVTPLWANQVTVSRNANGEVEKYALNLYGNKNTDVHPSRIVIIGDMDNGIPYLRAGYNDGVNIEKILGGSGESYLKNAARQLHIDYSEDADMEDLVDITGQTISTIRQAINEVVREINRGNDAALITQGAKVQMLSTAVSDPTGNFDVACASFGASVGLPIRAILGNQTGERASTEDAKMVAQRSQSRRINELSSDVARVIRAIYEAGCIKAPADFEWDDLTEQTMGERIESLDVLTRAFMQMSIMTPEQVALAKKLTGLDLYEQA